MQNFDLHWPRTTAFLNTDGQRCRIVWRDNGGMGGTIDNNTLCIKRLADGLQFAPQLLSELRGAGYQILAEEIARLAPAPQGVEERRQVSAPRSESEQIDGWLTALEGDAAWAPCGTRRSKDWIQVAAEGTDGTFDALFLKTPGNRGKHDWVLKRVPSAGGSPEYFSSSSFRGVCGYLAATPPYASARFLDAFAAQCASLATEFREVRTAVQNWHARTR